MVNTVFNKSLFIHWHTLYESETLIVIKKKKLTNKPKLEIVKTVGMVNLLCKPLLEYGFMIQSTISTLTILICK